jgi:hypothetical protein
MLGVLEDTVTLEPNAVGLLGGTGEDAGGLTLGLLEHLGNLELRGPSALAQLGVNVAHQSCHLGTG